MNPVIIAAGIQLTLRIICFMADELTDADIKKQNDLDEKILEIHKKIHAETNDHDSECESEICESDLKASLYDLLSEEADERIKDHEDFKKQLIIARNQAKAALFDLKGIRTSLRKNSLELLLRQLNDSVEKCIGYIHYLKNYKNEIYRYKTAPSIPRFSMILPSSYPYTGKVIWIDTETLRKNYGSFNIDIGSLFTVYIKVKDYDIIDIGDQVTIPVMINQIQKSTRYTREFTASIEKGQFKAYELSNTHLGLEATVKELNNRFIILTYKNDLELKLPADKLINPNRFPPVRSTLTVYPVNWFQSLDKIKRDGEILYPVTVSERKTDASSAFEPIFFPICFSPENFNAFMDFYENNNLDSYGDEEFLIGPVNNEYTGLKKGCQLKIQFGDIPLFVVEVDTHITNNKERFFFRFHHLCDKRDSTFNADDLFVPFEVTFTPYYDGASDEVVQEFAEIEDYDDITTLIWDVFEELRIQNQIRNDRAGIGYFYKWESITDQLISVLETGDSIIVEVEWLARGYNSNAAIGEIKNTDEIADFLADLKKTLGKNRKSLFFVVDDQGERYRAEIQDRGRILHIVGKNAFNAFCSGENNIELFSHNLPYAVMQQKMALRQFRNGQVVNSAIQAACMNSSSIQPSHMADRHVTKFFNESLLCNESQMVAVEQVIREKNIFLIQGPPGTGKTTVIREIVEQELSYSNHSRILIVSQANVAVDNVLKGLIDTYRGEIVRCGSEKKISRDYLEVSLTERCREYERKLIERKPQFDDKFYYEWEKTIQPTGSQEYAPVLCELVIRNHRIICATCVGLSKKGIGLERTVFDLVIIDEAGKGLPAELLIPLIRAKKAVIIGDQKQLPPVIDPLLYDADQIELEERAVSENNLFAISFFERLYEGAPESNKIMLNTQYRMPKLIGDAVSQLFYDGQLKSGIETESYTSVLFPSNLTFINYDKDTRYHEEKNKENRVINNREASDVFALVMNLRHKDPKCSIAVITPYRGQKLLICSIFLNYGINYLMDKIAIDTIDSFQGSEADVVIFCTTRADKPTVFFRDSRRLNVALSRAKRELIILGKMNYFYRNNISSYPLLADYLKKHCDVLESRNCNELKWKLDHKQVKVEHIDIGSIDVPECFFVDEMDESAVQNLMNEYRENGCFKIPIDVHKSSDRIELVDGFEQLLAMQNLGLQECWCRLV